MSTREVSDVHAEMVGLRKNLRTLLKLVRQLAAILKEVPR